jgi:DNA-binding XRE family transcriptional regulator
MKKSWPLSPETETVLKNMGADLRGARLRRRLQTKFLAERAGISLFTLREIEKGSPKPSMGSYLKVIFALGLLKNIRDVFDSTKDVVGRVLEEERLPKRIRQSRTM